MQENENNKTKIPELLEFPIIIKAISGNSENLEKVKEHYKSYIKKFATKKLFDEHGQTYYYLDEDMFKQIENLFLNEIMNFEVR